TPPCAGADPLWLDAAVGCLFPADGDPYGHDAGAALLTMHGLLRPMPQRLARFGGTFPPPGRLSVLIPPESSLRVSRVAHQPRIHLGCGVDPSPGNRCKRRDL